MKTLGQEVNDAIMDSYDRGYEKGAKAVIDAVGKWLDEDNVDELKERFIK